MTSHSEWPDADLCLLSVRSGGGRFISSDGRVTTIESRDGGRELNLPDEVFASHEIDRRLDSITISAGE